MWPVKTWSALALAPQPTLLLFWSLACQSGLRRRRHVSASSAACAVLFACTAALIHPPDLDICCAVSLVAGLRARKWQTHPQVK